MAESQLSWEISVLCANSEPTEMGGPNSTYCLSCSNMLTLGKHE